MAEFSPFGNLVQKKFDEMSKGELFVTDVDPAALQALYLASFPEGTDPIYITNTEHDCTTCHNFTKNIGVLVSIVNGKAITVWDVQGAEEPYATVAAAMAKIVKAGKIINIFRSTEASYGKAATKQMTTEGKVLTWNHFHGKLSSMHFAGEEAGTQRGARATSAAMLERGLTELTEDSLATIVELIENKSLYRGDEFLGAVKGFRKLRTEYHKLDEVGRNQFVWANASNGLASFRNSSIGGLAEDLSPAEATEEKPARGPMDVEVAVDRFGVKVDPNNYKRSKSVITQRMVDDAQKTIDVEGVAPSLERRRARLDDISVNDVLWVDNSAQGQMKGGIAGLLAGQIAPPKMADDKTAEVISIDDFMEKVLPQVTGMEIQVLNSSINNFMTLTAPVHADSKNLFDWSNAIGWAYNGDITDSMRARVAELGGRVDGVLRFTHSWNYDPAHPNQSLMDLHVFMPGSRYKEREGEEIHNSYPTGRRIGWNVRADGLSGGKQDVDFTTAPGTSVPVENITFPNLAMMPEGKYTFKIHNWNARDPNKSGFKAEIEFDGQIFKYEHVKPLKHHQWITLAEVELKNGVFTIEHKMQSSSASRQHWGIATQSFVKVKTLMKSPNHWEGNAVGQKHWFFILQGCKTDEPMRGIFNEYLKPEFYKHRKVFEILGAQTKCDPTDDELSGLGFATTKGQRVLINVSGVKMRKTYLITF